MRAQRFSCSFALLLLGACAPTVVNRGNLLAEEKLAIVKPGAARETVLAALGSPTVQGSFDDKDWYYVGRRTEQYAFLDPKVAEQQTVHIRFDDSGLVQAVETMSPDAVQTVAAAPGTTPSFGNEKTWMQDLFGNIGRAGLPTGNRR